jgi:hypothetical protein
MGRCLSAIPVQRDNSTKTSGASGGGKGISSFAGRTDLVSAKGFFRAES